MIPDLSIIVPTLNERDNIVPLVKRLGQVLDGAKWEVIFVDDDSQDGTLDVLQSLARRDERVRYIHRVGRRGLSSACLEGMSASSAPYLAVMDADLQHDETILPEMYQKLQASDLDLVIGSRYIGEGSCGDWNQRRYFISRVATRLAGMTLKADVADPMSGFFMLTRKFFYRVQRRVTGLGFKVLLDLIASAERPVQFAEVPFVFRLRQRGTSKLDTLVAWEYFLLLLDKMVGPYIPLRFVMFIIAGSFGAMFHVSILWLLWGKISTSFLMAQFTATMIAMTINFISNNYFTYYDKRLKGWKIIWGMLLFYSVCAIGAIVNLRLALYLFENGILWWLSGLLGAMVGAVWNYGASSVLVWRSQNRQR
jgi:dolichol-phosphate mannosyltransferase